MFIYTSKNNLPSEYLNDCHQISIIYKLLKNIMKYGSRIGQLYNEKKLSDEELMGIDILKWPILRLKLLKKLIDNKILPQLLKREFSSRATEEEDDILENKQCLDILYLIGEMVEKPEMNSFINLIKYIFDKKDSIKDIKRYIEIFIPYYKFMDTKLEDLNVWLPLIMKCFVKKQSFKICFSNNIEFKYDSENDNQNFKKLYFYFTQSELYLSKYSKYEIKLKETHSLIIEDEKKEKYIIRLFHIVNDVLDEERISDKRLEKIEKECKNRGDFTKDKRDEKESRHKFFKISDLFEQSKSISVGKFWMIIFNMSDKSVQSFCKLLTNYEKNLFNLFLRFFNNDKKESLDKFIEFINSLSFYSDNLAILNLEADEKYVSRKIKRFEDSKNKDADKGKLEDFNNTVLKVEGKKFKAINYFTDEIERDKIVKIYEKYIQNIEDIFIADKETKERNKLKKDFNDLSYHIKKLQIKNTNNNLYNYKKSLLEQINSSIQNEEFDKEEYEMYKNKYEQLKKLNQNAINYTNNIEYNIKWPLLTKDKNQEKSKTTLFLEKLIWYSKIKNAIDNIRKYKQNKDENFKYVLKLQEFEEMKYASNLIISTDEIIDGEFDLIYATLNSHYILKMIKNHLEQYLFNCPKEINKILENNLLLNDKDVTNKNDYYFIREKEKEIENDFLIQIPQLKPKDIVLLYMQFGAKNKKTRDYEPYEGPILKQISYGRILDVLLSQKIQILNDDYGKKTAQKTAIEIIFTLIKNTFDIKFSFDEFEQDTDNLLNKLKDENKENKQKIKEFVDIFKITLDIARKIDELNSKEKIKLTYDDVNFLKEDKDYKWYRDIDYTTKYPHLVYILNKYEGLYDDLKEFCKIPKDETDSIPYWLILLRLLANKENIEVDYNQENNNLSKRVSEAETNYLQTQLIKLKNNENNKIDTSWLNLCIKNLKNSSLHSKKLRNIFEYIFYQIQNIPKLEKPILDIIEENMTSFNNDIIELNFNKQLENIFNLTLDKDEALIKMINNPNELYLNEVQNKYDEIIDDLINDTSYKKLVEFYKGEQGQEKNQGNNGSKPFKAYYNSLKDEINGALTKIDEDYNNSLKLQITKATDEKVNTLISLMNDINNFPLNIEYLNKQNQSEENQINKNYIDSEEINDDKNRNINKFVYFNNLIKIYEENLLKYEKNQNYITSTKKPISNYVEIEILLENKRYVQYQNEIFYNEINHNIIQVIINSKQLNEHRIELDLLSNNIKYSFYMPIKEGVDMSKLILLKDNDKEIKLDILSESKYRKELYFLDRYYMKRKINIVIKTKKINKYSNININKEKIRNDIEFSSSKNDNRITLNFGQYSCIKNTKLYKKLEKFNTNNINFSKEIKDIMENRKINSQNIISSIESLFKEQEQISKYLKCNSSDGTQFPKITEKLNDIQNYFNQLVSLFKNFDSYIRNDVNDFAKSYDLNIKAVESMFKNFKIKSPISTNTPKFNFKLINPDSNYLATLIISEENGKVACSQADISGGFGNFVASLIKGDFSIYILSMVNEKLFTKKEFPVDKNGLADIKYEKIIDIKNEIEPNELFAINIKIPKKTLVEDEEFKIKFDLVLGNNNLSEIKIPCDFNFMLSSLKIKLECLDYDIIINNDELFLGTAFLDENESIRFKVKYLNENIKTNFQITYKGNDENEAREPKLFIDKNNFNLNIANEYEKVDITEQKFNLKLFSAIIYIHITNEIFIPINIKAKIAPFKFKITAYDFYKTDNAIENDLNVFYGKEQLAKEQKLFFKIILPNKKKKYKGKIQLYYKQNQIEIIDKSLDNEFEISESTKFDIKYKINKESMNDIQLLIKIIINSNTKEFSVIFQYSPPILKDGSSIINFEYYPTLIPLFIFKKNSEGKFNLSQINNNNILEKTETNIFVTPFEISEINPILTYGDTIDFLLDEKEKNNLFYELDDEGNLEVKNSNKTEFKLEEKTERYGIIFEKEIYYLAKSLPLIGKYKDIWYPTINDFAFPKKQLENIGKKNIKFYDYDEVKNEAPKKFLNLFSKIDTHLFTAKAIGNIILNEKVFNNIEKIISELPDEMKNKIYKKINLVPISEEIKNKADKGLDKLYKDNPELFKGTIFNLLKENKKEKITILKNNIIFAFIITLQDRYDELKKNGFRDFILIKEEDKERFNNKVEDMRNKYFCIKKEPKIPDNFGLKDELYITDYYIERLEKEKKKLLKQNDNKHFPSIKLTHYNNTYKYEQFSEDELNKTDTSIIIQDENKKTSSSKILASDINLPDLVRPETDLTLNKLIDFYNEAIKYTRILPIFIRSALKKNDENDIKKAEECFSLLLNTYKAFKPEKKSSFKDTSFLGQYVNDFVFSFEKMVSKLKKAGLKIIGLDFDLNEADEKANEILKMPEYENLDEKNNFWNIYKKKDFIEINKPFYDTNRFNEVLKENKEALTTNDYDTNTYNNQVKIEDEKPPISSNTNLNNKNDNVNNNYPLPLIPNNSSSGLKSLKIDTISNNKSTNENTEFNAFAKDQEKFDTSTCIRIITNNSPNPNPNPNPNQDSQNQDMPVMKLNSNAINKMTVNPKAFGNNNVLFNERDGIEKSIIKIKAMDDNEKFSYEYKKFDNYYPKAMESQISDLITIKDMVNSSKYISQIFIKFFSENDIPFLNEGVTILIDCSGYINKDNKLFNMHLICGLTEGLNAIGMQYSVALISDENFKRIIKKFDMPHNIYELQKIYECYMIPRYRTNLAKSLHFAIDNLKFVSDASGVGKINSNTAFFIFTDGMDENLYFGKEFKNYIFNNPNLSFGFVFIKSSFLSDEYNKILEDLWNKFLSETNGSLSKIQIEKSENKYDIKKIEAITVMFINILTRNIEEQNYKLGNYPIEKPTFEIPYKEELNSDSLNIFEDCLKYDYTKKSEIFYNVSQIRYNKIKADKLDSNLYNNKIGKIMNCRVSNPIKNEYNKFLNNFIIPKNKVNIAILDQIFLPNKASTMVLSTTGSEIDIPAFIKYLFENNPNPMIYLEKKGGFTKHYSVSIIIDSSFSCLNKFSFPHTVQTIRTLISSIASINIPAVDIIVATSSNPIIICSDVPSIKLLGKANILPSLLKVLSKPCLKANLLSALKAAKELQKIGSKDTTKYMFVLTDGLYQQNELDLIKNRIFDCMQTSLLIGVGVGFYPLKIKKLFVQNIYVPNPLKLFSGIGISAAKSNDKYTSTMPYLDIIPTKPGEFDAIVEELSKTGNPVNKELVKELENIEIEMDAFSDFYNAEKEQYDNSGSLINPTGKNTSMYAEGFLEGHEILFVCLYNCDMNPNEDPCTNYNYLFKQSPKANYYFNQCAQYYKAKVNLVLDYEDAINEIIKPWDKDPNKGKYYAVWIVCGPPYPMLPENKSKKTNPYLLGHFMKVINMYNQNGGSVIFLTESDPLFYQANLFLRDLYLYDKKGNKVKVDLQLEGEHKGDTILQGDKSGELKNAGLFNKSSQSFKNLTRSSLSHNLVSYYEGYTIDYADYNKVMNSPFYPFARDSEGGVAGFFYPADIDGRGDIVFNCSYTSLYFTKKENDGTYRYYENIIAWTSRPEIHLKYDQCLIKDYRPKKVNYTIDYNNKWTEFKELPKKEITEDDLKKMKTLFCIDASGSVDGVTTYHNVTRNIFNKFYKNGDLIWLWGDSTKKLNLSDFKTWNNNRRSGLGGTASELIADIIFNERNSGIEHLVIITDGSVNGGSIDRSDNKMKSYNIHLKFVSTYIIGSGGDRSVGAPYCRGDPSVTYIYKSETSFEKLASLSHQQIDLYQNFHNISSYSEFISKYGDLKLVIEAQMYGRNRDNDLIKRLESMKNNILSKNISQQQKDDFNAKYKVLYTMADGGLRNGMNFTAY